MTRRELIATLLGLVAVTTVPGCFTDSVTSPEPTLITPGAFIAVPFEPVLPTGSVGEAGQAGASGTSGTPSNPDAGGGGAAADSDLYQLIRVLAVLDVTNDLAIFHFQYGVVESLDEARAATKARSSGPPPPWAIVSLGRLESAQAVVVGYRSLTEEEQDVIR